MYDHFFSSFLWLAWTLSLSLSSVVIYLVEKYVALLRKEEKIITLKFEISKVVIIA